MSAYSDALTLEIQLLTGGYRASLPDGSGAEWPPHPERVYSALVQAWGDGGKDLGERAALEWLERQPDPLILIEDVPPGSERDAPIVYVPPNDARGDQVEVLPERRKRQARAFRCQPTSWDSTIRMTWPDLPEPVVQQRLAGIASRVASIGHSSSLVRCAFVSAEPPSAEEAWRPHPDGGWLLRTTYGGRLEDLDRWFEGRSGRQERPRSRRATSYEQPGASERAPRSSVFGGPESWIVLEGAGGFQPDLLALAHVTRRLRDALMSRGPQPAPELITGHAEAGKPSSNPHLAILPLANLDFEHSNGDLLGLALIPPRDLDASARRPLLQALAALSTFRDDVATLSLHLFGDQSWILERSGSPSRASLSPRRWCETSREWRSATPVLLDRFPDHDDPLEEARLIAAACRNIGLPEPAEIEIHKHAAVKGAMPAYPARGRTGIDWTFPAGSRLADRPRRHVVLRFEEPVSGPVVLGAGRYHGFGMCLPTRERR